MCRCTVWKPVVPLFAYHSSKRAKRTRASQTFGDKRQFLVRLSKGDPRKLRYPPFSTNFLECQRGIQLDQPRRSVAAQKQAKESRRLIDGAEKRTELRGSRYPRSVDRSWGGCRS